MSGLARAITGKGMRQLIREELAAPLDTDGLHLGRLPGGAPTRVAEIIMPQNVIGNPVIGYAARKVVTQLSGGFRSLYFRGVMAAVQGEIPLLDAEMPAANGVATARALARMYGAIATAVRLTGTRFLSPEILDRPDRAAQPESGPKHHGAVYISPRLPHHAVWQCDARLWARRHGRFVRLGRPPASGLAFSFVHNRLLSPFLVLDHSGLATLGTCCGRASERPANAVSGR